MIGQDPMPWRCVAVVVPGSEERCPNTREHGDLCGEHRAAFVAAGLIDGGSPPAPPLLDEWTQRMTPHRTKEAA